MRTGMTQAFIDAKNATSGKPRQMFVFQFKAGNVYVSDQRIELGGVVYEPLVEDWGSLEESADIKNRNSSEVRQLSPTLWNGGSTPLSDRFLEEDPENVEVLLYQWYAGLTDADKYLDDIFVIQDDIEFDESARLLALDLVSINMRYDGQCCDRVTTEQWPYAKPEHVGKPIQLVFGDAGRVDTLCVRTAPMATLFGSMVKNTSKIDVNESLDAKGFPQAGFVQIEEEIIQYSSRSDSALYVQTRGYYPTVAIDHSHGAECHLLINDHTFLVGEGPLQQITGVQVDGFPAPSGIYTTSISGQYGQIIFTEKPYSLQFARSVETTEWTPNLSTVANTAWQPHYAMDEEKTTSSALISELYRTLAIVSSDAPDDTGSIATAYLSVRHWETNIFESDSDYVEVWVEGIGVVGRLSKPSNSDMFEMDADVDIDHPHNYDDPGVNNTDPAHPHNTGATQGLSANANVSDFYHGITSNGSYGYTHETTLWFLDLADSASSSSITINTNTITSGGTARIDFIEIITEWGGTILLQNIDQYNGQNGAITISGGGWPKVASNQNYWIKIRTGLYVNDGTIKVYYKTPIISYNAYVDEVDANNTGVNAYVDRNGVLHGLLTDNRVIEIASRKNPGRSVIDRFDLSDFITPSWTWFAGREIQIRYKGSIDDVNVFITHVTFEIEFKRRQRVYSDKVTATVTGDPANQPGQVIQRLLTEKAGLPAAYIDSTSFAAVASEHATLGYSIDGIVAGMAVRAALKKVCWQTRSRLHWNGGKAKLALRKAQEDWTAVKSLVPVNYQLKSIAVKRQRVADLINHIELFYKIDQVNSGTPYLASVVRKERDSIKDHGLKEELDLFKFDLVRDDTMAADLAAYFIAVLAWPSTYYEFNTYLDHVELEKEDAIELTSAGFNKIRKMPLLIKAIYRVFGSGKNETINHLKIIAQNIRYILLTRSLKDSVLILDSLQAVLGQTGWFADHVHIIDELRCAVTVALEEGENTAVIMDTLSIIWEAIEIFDDSVTVLDELSAGIGVHLTDSVTVLDDIQPWRGSGFGSSEFGKVGFGGVVEWGESNPDEIVFVDELLIEAGINLAETVAVADHLVASNGFGSIGSIAAGFGYIPFGR